jgi:ATP-dependent DNA ligase
MPQRRHRRRGAKGRPDFSALQVAIGEGAANIVAYVFDLLFLDGRDCGKENGSHMLGSFWCSLM